jgi:DNA-directed RNA polymerase specialized sigma24 family protein
VAVSLVELESLGPQLDLLTLNDALQQLERRDHRAAELVKLRFFAGLTIREAAQMLSISVTTAESDWAYARSWLKVQLSEDDSNRVPLPGPKKNLRI